MTENGSVKIDKAYKYGVDRSGTIWVSGADFQKYYNKRTRLLKRHNENPNPASDGIKKLVQPRLSVLVKYQQVSKRGLSSAEQVLLHDIARNILRTQGLVE